MKYYVYLLKDGDKCFYVGKGSGGRMYDHYKRAKNSKIKSPVLNKIRSMIKEDKKVLYEKIFIGDEVESIKKEIETIELIGRKDLSKGNLLNLTNGGDGVRGYVWTDEHRKNLSNAIKKAIKEGRFVPGSKYGGKFVRTDEYKEKMSKTLKDYWDNDELRNDKSNLMKSKLVNGKRVLSEKSRKRMNTASKRVWTDEDRENYSEKMKQIWKKRKEKKE